MFFSGEWGFDAKDIPGIVLEDAIYQVHDIARQKGNVKQGME